MSEILACAFAEAASNAECARAVCCQRLFQFLLDLGDRCAGQTGSFCRGRGEGAALQPKGPITLARDSTRCVAQPFKTR